MQHVLAGAVPLWKMPAMLAPDADVAHGRSLAPGQPAGCAAALDMGRLSGTALYNSIPRLVSRRAGHLGERGCRCI